MELQTILTALSSNQDSVAALIAIVVVVCVWLLTSRRCKVCKKDVIIAQMKMYDDNMAPIISKAKDSFESDLREYVARHHLPLDKQQLDDIIKTACELLVLCFGRGRSYMQGLVNYNHIPDPDDKDFFHAFMVYIKEKFDAHNVIIWDSWKLVQTAILVLDVTRRKEKWEENNNQFFAEWEQMFRTFKKISIGKYKVGKE
jgi:hypothetical protein